MKTLFFIAAITSSLNAFAQSSSELEMKLDALNVPDDKVTPILSDDKLYVVNTRYSSLINRHEIGLMGANNFTSDSHLTTQNVSGTYRYHINGKWGLGLRYSRYTNKLTSAGEKLFSDKKILPDTDYALNSKEIFVNYNTVYGKLRLTEDSVVYFDQYASLGAGKIKLASGEKNIYSLDLGFSFWLGQHGSSRLGIKNEFYKQQQLSGARNVHNVVGYLELGYLFGSGDRG